MFWLPFYSPWFSLLALSARCFLYILLLGNWESRSSLKCSRRPSKAKEKSPTTCTSILKRILALLLDVWGVTWSWCRSPVSLKTFTWHPSCENAPDGRQEGEILQMKMSDHQWLIGGYQHMRSNPSWITLPTVSSGRVLNFQWNTVIFVKMKRTNCSHRVTETNHDLWLSWSSILIEKCWVRLRDVGVSEIVLLPMIGKDSEAHLFASWSNEWNLENY